MNEQHFAIRIFENLSSGLMKMCRSQYSRTGGTAADQMFYDTAEESCTIWMAELANDMTSGRSDRLGAAKTECRAAGRVIRERMSDYEPVDKVPFPNSSRMIRDRSVLFLKANETWLRSIMKADCS